MIKDFEHFRNEVITEEKLKEIIALSEEQANKVTDERDFLVTFSANFSLYLLAEYHEWITQSQSL